MISIQSPGAKHNTVSLPVLCTVSLLAGLFALLVALPMSVTGVMTEALSRDHLKVGWPPDWPTSIRYNWFSMPVYPVLGVRQQGPGLPVAPGREVRRAPDGWMIFCQAGMLASGVLQVTLASPWTHLTCQAIWTRPVVSTPTAFSTRLES